MGCSFTIQAPNTSIQALPDGIIMSARQNLLLTLHNRMDVDVFASTSPMSALIVHAAVTENGILVDKRFRRSVSRTTARTACSTSLSVSLPSLRPQLSPALNLAPESDMSFFRRGRVNIGASRKKNARCVHYLTSKPVLTEFQEAYHTD